MDSLEGRLAERFGVRVKALRGECHLSQREIAEAVGCKTRTVARWEHGKSIPRTHRQLSRLAAVLEVAPFELFLFERSQRGDQAALAAFVQRETKRDPGFPRRALRVLRTFVAER